MYIKVLGDTHGNTHEACRAVFQAGMNQTYPCDRIVQVGDFGYWEHTKAGVEYLDTLSHVCRRQNVDFYWIDGNHDNHELLWAKYTERNAEGFVEIRPRLFYIPRGHTWEWDGVRFMGCGGAYSIDKMWRIQQQGGSDTGQLWWKTEQLTYEQLEFAKSQGVVDVLFTHDAPPQIHTALNFRLKDDFESTRHQQSLANLAQAVRPKTWVHGHFHERVTYTFRHDDGLCDVHGLACDGMAKNSLLLDTDLVR